MGTFAQCRRLSKRRFFVATSICVCVCGAFHAFHITRVRAHAKTAQRRRRSATLRIPPATRARIWRNLYLSHTIHHGGDHKYSERAGAHTHVRRTCARTALVQSQKYSHCANVLRRNREAASVRAHHARNFRRSCPANASALR